MDHTNTAPSQVSPKPSGFLERFLSGVEIIGNRIPDPMFLFIGLAVTTIIFSSILSIFGFSALNPATGKTVVVYNLLTTEGLVKMLTSAISNFTSLPALGMVLVCMLGVGVCDSSGLFSASLRGMVHSAKGSDLKIIVVFTFACAMADAAGGTGFVIMPPLGALIFAAMGRHPIAGMLAAYATVSGAFASNLLVTAMDVVDVSFTQAASLLVDPNLALSPAINWYFTASSFFVLTTVSVLITTKFIEPRLGTYTGKGAPEKEMPGTTARDATAMRYAGVTLLIFIALVLLGTVPENGVLRDPQTGSLLTFKAPLMRSLPVLISLVFLLPGIAFGIQSGRFASGKDIAEAFGKSMSDMGPYIALMFFVAQFLKLFDWSNIGIILAIKGAEALQTSGLPISLVLVIFIGMSASINLLIGSASTKWAILSVVFVPMFMLLGYHPATVQMAFRIGDAATNPICPTFAYFAMLLALVKKYDDSAGFGTLIANMLPYSIAFLLLMVTQFLVWFFFEIPFGPGGPVLLLK